MGFGFCSIVNWNSRMTVILKLRCSRQLLVAMLASLALVTTLTLHFGMPVLSSIAYFGVQQTAKFFQVDVPLVTSEEVESEINKFNDFDMLSTTELHGAVSYRLAPWKADIGRWLASCHVSTQEVTILEKISGKRCKDDCNNNGVCSRDLGECRCFHGFAGQGCSEKINFSCNLPETPTEPYGRWVFSICSTHCDSSRGMCVCGEGTKYPQRPVPDICGFTLSLPSKPGDVRKSNWSKPDTDILRTNGDKEGWCNVDPKDAYAGKVKYKDTCYCNYAGSKGRFCEIPAESYCFNQCSGRGHCRGGFCVCDDGWYGTDCSTPSSEPSLVYTSEKKRPLIFVYDLPAELISHLYEGRHSRYHCVSREYDGKNKTVWLVDRLYVSQMAFYESILASSYRTFNGDEADYFLVPVFDSCIIQQAYETPHLQPQEPKSRGHLALDYYKRAYSYIAESYPFWNRSSGRDHIWFFSWDEGACCAPKEIWNSMMIVHWGNTNSKHKNSTTAYGGDNWDSIPLEKRGNHPCFDPQKDLVIPAWKTPNATLLKQKLWLRPLKKRNILFYFNGNLGSAYEHGRPEDRYSMGIRQRIASEFGSSPDKNGNLGKQHEKDVIVVSQRSNTYFEELSNSVFCGVFPGDGWSGRMEDSVMQGCIPVVVQDGIYLPYENVLNYDSFAVRIAEEDIPNLVRILRGFNESEIRRKRANVVNLLSRFYFRDAVVLEGKRQYAKFREFHEWDVHYSQLPVDDVFATVLQVLHYKLHNDPWRRELPHHFNKTFGLPQECIKNHPSSNYR